MEPPTRCPCGTGHPFADCCGPYLAGQAAAPTAEALMRSRYTAYATGDREYLMATWHPVSRPPSLSLDPEVRWLNLTIRATEAGGPQESQGEVEFIARYRQRGRALRLHERSRFVRVGGRWTYLDGQRIGD